MNMKKIKHILLAFLLTALYIYTAQSGKNEIQKIKQQYHSEAKGKALGFIETIIQ